MSAVCILEQIAQAVKAKLDELFALGRATSAERPLRTGVPDSPADKSLVLYQDDATEDDEQPPGFLQWIQPFVIDCYVWPSDSSAEAVDSAVNDLRARVERKLMEDVTLGSLALNAHIGAPQHFLHQAGVNGVRVTFSVIYRTREDDPYAQK